MRIDKIRIQNFKLFKEQTFRLNPNFTVFIGGNGTGKTSILDAIAVAAGSYLLGIDAASGSYRSIRKQEIRNELINGQPTLQFPGVISAEGLLHDTLIVEEQWEIDKISSSTNTQFGKAAKVKALAKKCLANNRNPDKARIVLPLIGYHGTGRLWLEHDDTKASRTEKKTKVEYQKQEEGVVMAYKDCLSAKSSSKIFLSWFKTLEDELRKFDQARDRVWRKVFTETIVGLIPEQRWADIAFSFRDDDLIGVYTDAEGEKNLRPFSQLSDGYRNFIGLVADLIYRCIQLNPHLGENVLLETPGIVLIDELDLHLHPNWQRRIVADLKRAFPKVQFVATTHSPFIVQSLKKDELIVLDTHEDDQYFDTDPFKASIEDNSEFYMGVDIPQRSIPFEERVEVATEYYRLIRESRKGENTNRIEELRQKLNELELKFGDDPVFVAHLISERKINRI